MNSHEIDKLVGKHVMQWRFESGPEGRWYEYTLLVATEDWSPSTDIACAWQVLEKFSHTRFGLLYFGPSPRPWACQILVDEATDVWGKAMEDTAPMAICLASLRAVGVESANE